MNDSGIHSPKSRRLLAGGYITLTIAAVRLALARYLVKATSGQFSC